MIRRLIFFLTAFSLLSAPSASIAQQKPLVSVGGITRQLPSGATLGTQPATTGAASINVPAGTPPTSPVDGDCWTTTGGYFCRINGTTINFTQAQLASPNGTLGLTNGGTGATTASAARTALAVPGLANSNTFSANQTIGTGGAAGGLIINRNAGFAGFTAYQTATSPRWFAGVNATAESGSDVGSDWYIDSYTDAGAFKHSTLRITRSTGVTNTRSHFPLTDNTFDLGSGSFRWANIYSNKVSLGAATASSASLSMPHGTAPTSPTNGDVWTTTAGIYARVNGATVGPLIADSYTAPGAGAVAQSITGRLAKQLFATDYGVKCDGATVDTTAINTAVSAAITAKATLYFPSGICLTAGNTITAGYADQFAIIGAGRNQTIIRKSGATTTPVLTIGSAAATNFYANIEVSGITFDGVSTTTEAAVRTYDLVRSNFHDVAFMNSAVGYLSYGGIANNFHNIVAGSNNTGMLFTKFTSSAGGGWPNLNKVTGSQIVDNHQWGIDANYVRMLMVDSTDIEGNGTTLAANEGGIRIGANVGEEVTISDPESIGFIGTGNWYEANKGRAQLYFMSGINSDIGSTFFSQASNVTNDVRIDGGRYRLRNLNIGFSKTANVLEGGSVASGNVIDMVDAQNLSYSSTKTSVFDGYRAFVGNGAVPGINGMTAPLIERITDSSGVNPTITFSQAFKTATTPKVYCQAVNNSASTIDSIDVYSISNTGFTLRKKSFNGTTIGTSNYTVECLAVGENP